MAHVRGIPKPGSMKALLYAVLYGQATTRWQRIKLRVWCWWKKRPYPTRVQ